nr:cleavage and polyadenylation [Hymenolepis microstoma]
MATSIIKLHTFSGACDNFPPCYILQVDDFYCLLDCGYSETLPESRITEIGKWVKKISAVLVSHASLRHLGLLPVLYGKYGLRCPVYTTIPVCKLGQLVCYDEFQSRYLSKDFKLFTLDDIDNVFRLVVPVKYSQTTNLQGKGRGLSITPLPSGHMLGGTIWKIVKDETDIIYAVDFNNEKSRHLSGAALDACIRPRLLIIDASNALYTNTIRKDRNSLLRDLLLKTLRRGGNALIAVDSTGYSLELAYILDNLWHSPVILATDASLRAGFSRLLFADWADNELNSIVLTSRDGDFREVADFSVFADNHIEPPVSLGRRLIGLARMEDWAREGLAMADEDTLLIPLHLSQRVPVFSETECEANTKENPNGEAPRRGSTVEGQTMPSNPLNTKVFDENQNIDDDEEENDENGLSEVVTGDGAINFQPYPFLPSQHAGVLTHGRHLACYDIVDDSNIRTGGQFFRSAKLANLTFPVHSRIIQWDEYGEKCDTTIYRLSNEHEETKMTPDKKRRRLELVNLSSNRNKSNRNSRIQSMSNGAKKKAGVDLASAPMEKLLNLLVLQNTSSVNVNSPDFQIPNNMTTKCVSEELEIPLRCEVSFIDFESRSDGESLRKIITGLRPHEVIVIGATQAAVNAVVEHCRSDLNLRKELIHTPSGVDVVNCTKESDIYQARMKDSLVRRLRFTKIREYDLAWVDADISTGDENNTEGGAIGIISEGVSADNLPVLNPPAHLIEDHSTVFVNEPRLSDMKQLLLEMGLQAEFNSGALVVENCVSIKRTETGKMTLEGVISPTYFTVRDLLYRQFAIL